MTNQKLTKQIMKKLLKKNLLKILMKSLQISCKIKIKEKTNFLKIKRLINKKQMKVLNKKIIFKM